MNMTLDWSLVGWASLSWGLGASVAAMTLLARGPCYPLSSKPLSAR